MPLRHWSSSLSLLGITLTAGLFGAEWWAEHAAHGSGCLSDEQRQILDTLSLVQLEDGRGGLVPTIRVSGVNLQIVNGLAATNGLPSDPLSIDPGHTTTNGTGNLIVGYNEQFGGPVHNRTGSHNVVIGSYNDYSSYGGLVSAQWNRVEAPYATADGGRFNTASGPFSSVRGGDSNEASGVQASIHGGEHNSASGFSAAVLSGFNNSASGSFSSVSGGTNNLASGSSATIAGGSGNLANGQIAAVGGGSANTASGWKSSVGGGANRTVVGDDDWRAGSLFQDD